MDEPDTEVIDSVLCNELINELQRARDARALRRALLFLVLLVQEDEREAVREFVAFVLQSFPAIANAFVNHKHPLVGGIEVLRAQNADGRQQLLLPLDRVHALIHARVARGSA